MRCDCPAAPPCAAVSAAPPSHRRPPAPPSALLLCRAPQAAGCGGARPVQLADIPGHPRVRGQLERYAERAAGVVFVIDSVDFMPRKTEAAE